MPFFHRLRYQIMLLAIVLAVLPLLVTGYFMIRQASRGVLPGSKGTVLLLPCSATGCDKERFPCHIQLPFAI